MADDDLDMEELLGQGQESPADRWLTDEEYASGKWYRFALERLLPMAQSTRLTTAQMEFVARAGWFCYIPRKVWVSRNIETNDFADDEQAIFPLFNSDGSPVLNRGRLVLMQGSSQVPIFLSPKDATGSRTKLLLKKWLTAISVFNRRDLPSNTKDVTKALLKREYTVDGEIKALDMDDLVERRYWIPTPILGESFVQAPRLPFDMVPKDALEEAYQAEIQAKTDNPDEFVDYQYCGCPGLDEELIRAYRTNSEPRTHRISNKKNDLLPAALRAEIAAGAILWRKVGGKFQVVRRVENEAGITMRVHRQVAENYVTARQVFEGLERLKRRYFDPAIAEKLRYKPVPDDFPAIDGVTIGDTEGADVLEVEKWVRALIVRLSKTDPIAAARLQRRIRKDFEDWIEQVYDRTYPNEQLRYREWFYDLQMLSGDDWASRADRWHFQMQLRIHFKKVPGIISSAPQRRANFLEMELQVADFESWRNLEHMQEHWKYSKAMQNTLTSFDSDRSSPKNMRQRDWGGIWNPWRAELDWRWNKLNTLAPKPTPGNPGNSALRRQLLNPAWFEKEPWQMMDHDGSLIDRFGQKKVNWVDAMGKIKGLSSAAGTGAFPKRKEGGLEKTLVDFRQYRNEFELLLYDEYFARDPVDVIENQKGLVIFSIMDDVNLRLANRYDRPERRRHPELPDRGHCSRIRLTYDTACQNSRFVELMWKLQPVGPIKKAVEGSMRRWKRENKRHFRPLIDRMIDGLYMNVELRREVERWYRDSDERIWGFVYYDSEMMSDLESGVSDAGGWGLKDSLEVCKEGFGTGYGPVEMWQTRQEKIIEVGLWRGYYDVSKGILEWWSVRVTQVRVFDPKGWPDINDLKAEVGSALKSRKLIWPAARDFLWPKLRVRTLIPSDEPFPLRSEFVDDLQIEFVTDILDLRSGNNYIPDPDEAELHAEIRRVREVAIAANHARYIRVAAGEFFEINRW